MAMSTIGFRLSIVDDLFAANIAGTPLHERYMSTKCESACGQ